MIKTKIALVTGGNKGIGFETCRQFGHLGIKVLLAARNEGRGRAAAEKLRAEGLDVEPVLLDVTDSAQITVVRDKIAREYGQLDILVNNAGMGHVDDPSSPDSVARGRKWRKWGTDPNFPA